MSPLIIGFSGLFSYAAWTDLTIHYYIHSQVFTSRCPAATSTADVPFLVSSRIMFYLGYQYLQAMTAATDLQQLIGSLVPTDQTQPPPLTYFYTRERERENWVVVRSLSLSVSYGLTSRNFPVYSISKRTEQKTYIICISLWDVAH
jgi:hypothetical protein